MLKTALEKFKSTKLTAETEVAGDFKSRPGREMMRRQAQSQLPTMRSEVAAEFKKVGFPIFVSGAGAKTFSELVGEQAESVVIDFRSATSDLRTAVKGSIGNGRDFGVNSFTVLLREVRQLGAQLGLTSIPVPQYDGVEHVQSPNDVDDLVDRYLLKYFGPEFMAASIEQEACRRAEDLSGESPVVPVVILGVPADLVEKLGPKVLQGKFISVTAPEDVDEKTITKTFKEVKSILKSEKQ